MISGNPDSHFRIQSKGGSSFLHLEVVCNLIPDLLLLITEQSKS